MTFQNFFIGDYTVQIPLSFEVIHQENESRVDESKNCGRKHSNNSVKKRRVFFSESES